MQTLFPCVRCGLCCRSIGSIKQLRKLNDGSGKCIHLHQDNLCEIYHRRPLWCNVEEAYKHMFLHLMTEKEFIVRNLVICIELNRQAGNEGNCIQLAKVLMQLESSIKPLGRDGDEFG